MTPCAKKMTPVAKKMSPVAKKNDTRCKKNDTPQITKNLLYFCLNNIMFKM